MVFFYLNSDEYLDGISGGLSVIYGYRGTWHTRVGVWAWRGGEGGKRHYSSSGLTNGDMVHTAGLC